MLNFVEYFVCREVGNGTVKINMLVDRITSWSGVVFVKLHPVNCVCRRAGEDDFWKKRHCE